MYPVKIVAACSAACAFVWAAASYADYGKPQVRVISSGPYEIVGNGTSAWVLDTKTGQFKYCEKPNGTHDKPVCSKVQSFD